MRKTKQALLLSALSLLVCISMLIGTTFAWFTDSVSSVNNIIKSGNLDIEVSYSTNGVDFLPLGADPILPKDALWEPGYTRVVALSVKNVGSLAAKLDVATKIVSETEGINVYDESFKLSEYLDIYSADSLAGVDFSDRASVKGMTAAEFGTSLYTDASILPNEEKVFVLGITMPETVGNEANHKTGAGNQPSVTFGLTVLAAQLMHEYDSFGNDYDKDATYPEVTVPVDGITLDMAELTVEMGKTATLTATVSPENATNKKVTWTSSDESVATVDENGVVTAVALGTATISVKAGEFSDSCTVSVFKEYARKLNAGHNKDSSISTSTGADFLPVAAVNPGIYGYSVFDGDTRIANYVYFRYNKVAKETIDENSYKILVDLEVLDENRNALELKSGSPYNTGKEYLHVYLNLIEVPTGYSISTVKVNGSAFTLTNNASGNPAAGEYWIGYDQKDIYLQSKTAGLIEITVTKN